MIKSVGQNMSAAIEATRLREGGKTRASSTTGSAVAPSASASASPAARMAAEGAPVDMDRIAAIKSAIASGNYPVNAAAIADRMVELDLSAAG
ncbi:flagellar biosynthesis anti-sigma factor FlgM [Sphingobium sp. Ant17]|jgi:negative regulator of flagellin synthesis FlgM|uniref:flagellar biosynthesis anti-sigma factor FlgM n=1 Tax=Sphingobium sp. Ant17 TaxID=1461752 RepID=UPI0004470B3E|nr:flagellar biosynthesis anti-sigma factor FlgM [Sphingobium sp. Ant17]EXS70786.1 flagellar biosynthesis anti-sigma factor FlgM [Sphingobium sp. Ant17]MDE0947433.1 flagellar biosynthesis anti-sigma factor FlgM [Sphingobium sp.]OHC90610.1 MAG: flagellar biosynthesis anti-sigma factor FlgM [Sphingomonadales bacterium GWF1_63_6]|tara:strand:+ start:11386 stop:11664 length:279 start_codon:yes stop_codon:yes gene_type:complete